MPDRDETQNESPVEKAADTGSAEQFQKARISRREALRKMGLTAGFSTALLFSNDFLRVVLGRLAGRRTDEALADTLSDGLRQAGSLVAPREEFLISHRGATVRPVASSSSKKAALAVAHIASSSKKAALAVAHITSSSSKKAALAG